MGRPTVLSEIAVIVLTLLAAPAGQGAEVATDCNRLLQSYLRSDDPRSVLLSHEPWSCWETYLDRAADPNLSEDDRYPPLELVQYGSNAWRMNGAQPPAGIVPSLKRVWSRSAELENLRSAVMDTLLSVVTEQSLAEARSLATLGLSDSSAKVRSGALDALATMNSGVQSAAVIRAAIRGLNDSDSGVRDHALEVLLKTDSADSYRQLREFLASRARITPRQAIDREAVKRSCGAGTPSNYVPIYLGIVRDALDKAVDAEYRAAAVSSLGFCMEHYYSFYGNADAVRLLGDAARDPAPSISQSAVRALEQIARKHNDSVAKAALTDLMHDR